MFTYFLLWIPMLFIAIANGGLRELLVKKWMNDLAAHQLSTFTLLVFFSVYIFLIIRKFPPSSSAKALMIGLVWIALTLIFEFGFGRWRGHSWATLLQDYNIFKGRLWLFVPVWVGVAPYLSYKLLH